MRRRLSLVGWGVVCLAGWASGCDEGSQAEKRPPTTGQDKAAVADKARESESNGSGAASTPGDEVAGEGGAASGDDAVRERALKALAELDEAGLSDAPETQRTQWAELAGEELSACGKPRTLAECLAKSSECEECTEAAAYLARLVSEGYASGEIAKRYNLRYGEDAAFDVGVGDSPVRGPDDAAVTIVEFSNFACPHCKRAHPKLKEQVDEADGEVRWVFKHLPFTDGARRAGRAAVAAAAQGKFWEMADKLFANQGAFAKADLVGYAQDLGLDVGRFRKVLGSPESKKRVEADVELAKSHEIRSTPTILINGRRYPGKLDGLNEYIEEELR